MSKALTYSFLSALALVSFSTAQAAVSFQAVPNLGYTTGSTKAEISGTDVSSNASGPELGLDAGVRVTPLIFAGVGSRVSFLTFSRETGNIERSESGNNFAVGPVASVQLPMVPVSFAASWFPVSNTSLDEISYRGSEFRFGAGYDFLSMVGVRAEYTMQSYSSVELNGTEADLNDSVSLTRKTFTLSLRVPLNVL